MTPKVSVISPIYKVASFIEKAAESMMQQTLQDVEYIFVDDATPDDSIDVLQRVLAKYPKRICRIIHHDQNKGLPSARNTGLAAAKGEYVFHWDSDDYAEHDMFEKMYDFAKNQNADIVWTDWYLTFSTNERRMSQPDYATSMDAIKGMLGGAMKYNVWNKLARRSLYDGILFPDGYGMGEDLTMLLVFANAGKVAHLKEAFYHYQKINSNAFSNSLKPQYFEPLKRNILWIAEELRKRFGNDLEKEISFLKLESKYPLLVGTGDFDSYRLWNEWFPEANKYISENHNVNFRSRFVQKLAVYKQYWAIWLHYQLICNLIYGIIYK